MSDKFPHFVHFICVLICVPILFCGNFSNIL